LQRLYISMASCYNLFLNLLIHSQLTAETGVSALIGRSVGAFKEAAPCEEGGIGARFGSGASASYLEG